MNKKNRATKINRQQYELFVAELENNVIFCNNINRKSTNAEDKIWKILVAKLNKCGGPQHTVGAWKRVFADWKNEIQWKDRVLKTKSRVTRAESCKKLTDLELRFLKIMGSTFDNGSHSQYNLPEPKQLHGPTVIENSDHIEFVNEDGAIISHSIDKLEFTCNGTPNFDSKERECNTPDRRFDILGEEFTQNKETESSFREEALIELKGIRRALEEQQRELHIQNEINKLRTQIEYEKIKAKYGNFNLEIQF